MRQGVLVIQNFPDTGPGLIADVAAIRGTPLEILPAFHGAPLPPDAGEHDGLIVLGGGQDAMDDAGSPYFGSLLDLMRDFHTRQRPLLGVCLGAQLLARAFGAENQIDSFFEFGFREIEPTTDGSSDPVLSLLTSHPHLFQWHADTFTLPPGAVRLATGTDVVNQAFRLGAKTYGIQFHFEVDDTQIDAWIATASAMLDARVPNWRETFPADRAAHAADARRVGAMISARWLDLL